MILCPKLVVIYRTESSYLCLIEVARATAAEAPDKNEQRTKTHPAQISAVVAQGTKCF